MKKPLLIYFSLYLVKIDFHGLVSRNAQSSRKQLLIFIFWFQTVSEDELSDFKRLKNAV